MAVAQRAKRSVRRQVAKPRDAAGAAGESAAATPPAPESPRDPLLTTSGGRIEPGALIFDPDWYRREYPDVAAAGLDPVRHFFDNGVREGRNPNRYFDTKAYASSNADVAAAGLNPFMHYLLYGAREGRDPSPKPDGRTKRT